MIKVKADCMGLGWDIVRHPQCLYPLVLNFPGGSVLRIHLLMQKMHVRSLGQEDPPEKEMTTHSSILAWEIPWTWSQFTESQKGRT